MGKFFFTILSGFAEMERELIRERIKLGLERRRKQGLPVGRLKGSKDKSKRKRLGYFQREYRKKKSKFKQTTPQQNTPQTIINPQLNNTQISTS